MGKDNSLYLWMEDFDNAELSPAEWQAQLEEAVADYNEEYGTNYSPYVAFQSYCHWKRQKQAPEQ